MVDVRFREVVVDRHRTVLLERTRRLVPALIVFAVACSSVEGTPNVDACASLPWEASFGKSAQQVRSVLQVEIADTDEERAKGLMGVTSLPENHGMAFVWDAPTDGSFWMKDTLIPLSIAFIGSDGRVVTLRDMAPCEADPCATYPATAPYVTAIEANAGWFDAHHVEVGDEVGLSQQACS
jgi:uncharacterized membrane protein (UPF0127 family)